jgi:hypothetical protein
MVPRIRTIAPPYFFRRRGNGCSTLPGFRGRLHATCWLSEANGRRQAHVGRDSARPPRYNTADLSLAGRAYAY